MRIGELARLADVGVETVRFYQRSAILPLPPKPPGGIRCYSEEHLKLLQRIRVAREVGFSLAEIQSAFSRFNQPCAVTHGYAMHKLLRVTEQINRFTRMSICLEAWIRFCEEDSARSVRDAIETTVGPLSAQTMGELKDKRTKPNRSPRTRARKRLSRTDP